MTSRILYKPGETSSPEYASWHGMKSRCLNPTDKSFAGYGGRGITVCARWVASYLNFLSDMGRKPSPTHTVDRIDNNGPYAPNNCRWACPVQQGNNRQTNHPIVIEGISLTVAEWARVVGIRRGTIAARLHKGMNEVDAVMRPLKKKYRVRWKRRPGQIVANQYGRKIA